MFMSVYAVCLDAQQLHIRFSWIYKYKISDFESMQLHKTDVEGQAKSAFKANMQCNENSFK